MHLELRIDQPLYKGYSDRVHDFIIYSYSHLITQLLSAGFMAMALRLHRSFHLVATLAVILSVHYICIHTSTGELCRSAVCIIMPPVYVGSTNIIIALLIIIMTLTS